jgi:structural maintenance of chromosome 2
MRTNVEQLKQDILEAKARQTQARADVNSIQRDMNEFKNNKGGKLAELQVCDFRILFQV